MLQLLQNSFHGLQDGATKMVSRYRVMYSIKNINCKKGDPAWNGGSKLVNATDTREASNKAVRAVREEILKQKELGPRTKIIVDEVNKIGRAT